MEHVEKYLQPYLQRRASQPETRRLGRHSGLKRARQRPENKTNTEQTSPLSLRPSSKPRKQHGRWRVRLTSIIELKEN